MAARPLSRWFLQVLGLTGDSAAGGIGVPGAERVKGVSLFWRTRVTPMLAAVPWAMWLEAELQIGAEGGLQMGGL